MSVPPVYPAQPPPSTFKRYATKVGGFVYDTFIPVAVFVIAALASRVLFPMISVVFYSIIISTVVVRIAVRITDYIKPSALDNVKLKTESFTNKYKVRYISIAVAILVCPFFPVGGIVVGAFFGILNGLLLGMEMHKPMKFDEDDEEYSAPSVRTTL